MADEWLRTGIGRSTPDAITVRGRDLASELMGEVTFTELAFFLTANRMPSPGEARLFDAALVALADHGLTPASWPPASRGRAPPSSPRAPSLAGLLGAGNVFLGVVEDTARLLAAILAGLAQAAHDAAPSDAGGTDADRWRPRPVARRSPGGGSGARPPDAPGRGPAHAASLCHRRRGRDPDPHLDLLRAVAEAHAAATGKTLPINGAGAAGAAWADLGFPPEIIRGSPSWPAPPG